MSEKIYTERNGWVLGGAIYSGFLLFLIVPSVKFTGDIDALGVAMIFLGITCLFSTVFYFACSEKYKIVGKKYQLKYQEEEEKDWEEIKG